MLTLDLLHYYKTIHDVDHNLQAGDPAIFSIITKIDVEFAQLVSSLIINSLLPVCSHQAAIKNREIPRNDLALLRQLVSGGSCSV
ncbi:hypothetical protein OK016_29825 [Vibrio chagasii]|nr:hypothetical protein [Vibrio chagasii]